MDSRDRRENRESDEALDTRAGDSGSEDWADPGSAEDNPAGASTETDSERLATEYLDQLQRLKAEFDNYRRRNAREREEWFLSARVDLLRQLIPVLDDVRRAREHVREPADAPETTGLLLVLKRLEDILTQLGLETQVAARGQEFDPNKHEAMMTVPSNEVAEGTIVQTAEPGYVYQGRMLRPIKVLVSSGPAPE